MTDNKEMSFHILPASGLTQQRFADRVGITQPALCSYVDGRTPSTQVLLKISVAFKISIDDIFAINSATDLREAAILLTPRREVPRSNGTPLSVGMKARAM